MTPEEKAKSKTDYLAAQLTSTYGAATFIGETGLKFEDTALEQHIDAVLKAAGYTGAADRSVYDILTPIFLDVYDYAAAVAQKAPQPVLDFLLQEGGFTAAVDLPQIMGERGHAIQAGIVAHLQHILPKDTFPMAALNSALILESTPRELPDVYSGEAEAMRRNLENVRLSAITSSRRAMQERMIIEYTELAARTHIGLAGLALAEGVRGDHAFDETNTARVTMAYGTSLAAAR